MGIAVLYGSSRRGGNSDLLANRLVEGIEADAIYLSEYNIQPITDYRHAEPGTYPNDDYHALIARVLKQDVIVFATPIYWYGISGLIKTFIDRWSQSLRENKADFITQMSSKTAYVIIVGDDEPQFKGLPLVEQFRNIFGFTGTTFGGYVIGTGNKPGDILLDESALFIVDQWKKNFH